MIDPYISVSGITDPKQAHDIREAVRNSGLHDDFQERRLIFGALASYKSLYAGGNKYPDRYVQAGDLWKVFVPVDIEDPCPVWLHYSEAPGEAQEGTSLFGRLSTAVEMCGCPSAQESESPSDLMGMADGIQINIPWPSPVEMAAFAREFPYLETCLQIGPAALQEASFGTVDFWNRLQDYAWMVDHILIDGSGGRGIPIEASFAFDTMDAIRQAFPKLGVGFAGGLCASKVYEVAHTLVSVSRVSVDAEGGIRVPSEKGGTLNLQAAIDYVKAVLCVTTVN